MESPIPIQNIYYLLCYAWNRLQEGEVVDVSAIQNNSLVNLFARVLVKGTQHLIRRGFDRGYLAFVEEGARIKGKIDFSTSLKKNLFPQGKTQYQFDELDYNVLHNRILKSTIARLVYSEGLSTEYKHGLFEILRRLRDVETISLSSNIFRRVQLHRNNHYYGFLLNICELIYDNLLVDEKSGRSKFRDFFKDEEKMGKLFEDFVLNFYRIEQKLYQVKSLKIGWQVESFDEEAEAFLPKMQTDICLFNEERKIILDCKFYKETFQQTYDKKTIHSQHMYQLISYVINKEKDQGWENCEGMLLYPVVSDSVDLKYTFQNHRIRIKTINLNQNWRLIHKDLLDILVT